MGPIAVAWPRRRMTTPITNKHQVQILVLSTIDPIIATRIHDNTVHYTFAMLGSFV